METTTNELIKSLLNNFIVPVLNDKIENNLDTIINNCLQEGLEKKALRSEYDLTYDIISKDPELLHLKTSIRKIVITLLAKKYFTTEDEIKSILRLTNSTISKSNSIQQSNYILPMNY